MYAIYFSFFLLIVVELHLSFVLSDEYNNIYTEFGTNIGITVTNRIKKLLLSANINLYDYNEADIIDVKNNSCILSFGNTSLNNKYININDIKDEGFQLISKSLSTSNSSSTSAKLFMVNGKPIKTTKSFSIDVNKVHYGNIVIYIKSIMLDNIIIYNIDT